MLNLKMKSKRGVSPLIATVLLIAFAVALGAVVMNWGRAQLEPQNQEGICSEIEITMERIGERPNICFNNENEVIFLLRNNGNVPVQKFRITLISNQPINPFNERVYEIVESGETKRLVLDYPEDFGDIEKIRITPIYIKDINNPLSEQICNDKSIEILKPIKC